MWVPHRYPYSAVIAILGSLQGQSHTECITIIKTCYDWPRDRSPRWWLTNPNTDTIGTLVSAGQRSPAIPISWRIQKNPQTANHLLQRECKPSSEKVDNPAPESVPKSSTPELLVQETVSWTRRTSSLSGFYYRLLITSLSSPTPSWQHSRISIPSLGNLVIDIKR